MKVWSGVKSILDPGPFTVQIFILGLLCLVFINGSYVF